MLKHLSIVITLLGTAACRPPHTAHATPAAQHGVDSSAVFPLPVAATGSLRWPTAARFDDGWVIAGNVFPFGLNTPVGHRALYLAHSRTGFLPLPAGDFLFAYPLVIATRDGALHLFWSEGPQSGMPDGWPYTWTEIWDATFAHGRWTTPERVIRGKWLSWESRAPQLVTDDSGRFHLVVTAADTGRPEETYHLMHDGVGWHRQGTGEHGLYPALASFPGGGLVMVLVQNDSTALSSGLYAKWSADYGRTWGPPVRVLDGAYTSAVYHTEVRVLGDSLYLGWIGSQGEDGDVWSLSRRRVASDGTLSAWTAPVRSPPIPGRLISVTFGVTGCGSIRALAEIVSPRSEAVVRELEISAGRVIVTQPLGDAFAIAPLTDRAEDRIIQLWNTVRVQKDSMQPFFRELGTCGLR